MIGRASCTKPLRIIATASCKRGRPNRFCVAAATDLNSVTLASASCVGWVVWVGGRRGNVVNLKANDVVYPLKNGVIADNAIFNHSGTRSSILCGPRAAADKAEVMHGNLSRPQQSRTLRQTSNVKRADKRMRVMETSEGMKVTTKPLERVLKPILIELDLPVGGLKTL